MVRLDGTPRYCRLTVNAGPRPIKFVGRATREGDSIRAERKSSTDAAPNDVTLHLLFASVEDVVRVEQRDPVYDEWVPWPEALETS